MKKHGLATLAATAAMLPFSALAESPDYTYLEADYIITGDAESAGMEDDYDGFELGGSVALTPDFFLAADYSTLSLDESGSDEEFLSLGAGINGPLTTGANAVDAYGMLTYENLDEEDSSFEADGFGLTGGLRVMATPMFEINPYISYLDYGSVDGAPAGANVEMDGWRFGINGLYSVNEQFAVTAGYRTTRLELSADGGGSADLDFESELRLGARFYFAGL